MPHSLKCKIKHLCHNGTITESERDRILAALKQESKTGHWITERISEIGGDKWSTNPKCSICGGEPYYSNSIYNYKYCPYCGARMESES